MASPYSLYSETLRDNGYRVMPQMPGTKVPGSFQDGRWQPLQQWSKWCEGMPPDFLHQKWEGWPDAGICLAHGNVVGLDIDTDRKDVEAAALAVLPPSPVRKRGAKGWTGYYRAPANMQHTARVRWYDGDKVAVELLLHGTQSVLPPSIHPDTKRPYQWITEETLESFPSDDLPELPAEAVEMLDRAFAPLGLTRQAPRRVQVGDYERPVASAHDLEKPFGRSLNDRAMEAIDSWWPALNMPKSRNRGRPGLWEAVPFWRSSNSGRATQDRNPNLRASPQGIVDFGADRTYTPVDLVMVARDCSYPAAVEWLEQFVRPEVTADFSGMVVPEVDIGIPISELERDVTPEPPDLSRWASAPVFPGKRSFQTLKPIALPTEAEFNALLPSTPPPFPIGDFSICEGLLGDVARHIDDASVMATEAGALAVSLSLLGAAFGRAYAGPTGLRTNIYTVALGGSGTGKTSLVTPAKELIQLAQLGAMLGSDRIASGSGLIEMLTVEPRRICFLDEFGHMLQQIGSAGAGIHVKAIMTEFTALYSAANTIFTGTARATRDPAPIDCPHLCLFGMATPDQFWRAFGSSALEDGSVARYLVFPLGQTAPKEPDPSRAADIARDLAAVQRVIAGRVHGNLGRPEVAVAPFVGGAERQAAEIKRKEVAFAEYAEKAGIRGAPSILRRVTENTLKIALISAVGRNPSSPEIDGRDIDIGHALAWWSANVMISNIATHIADNQTERDVNDVERFIVEGGGDGRQWRDVQRRFRRIKARDLKEIVEALEREGSVVARQRPAPGGGPATKVLFPAGQTQGQT